MYHRAKEPISLIYKELLILEGKKTQNLKEKKMSKKCGQVTKRYKNCP